MFTYILKCISGVRFYGEKVSVRVMRPNPNVETSNEFECADCGRRVVDPASRRCTECEGQLVNVSNERDL